MRLSLHGWAFVLATLLTVGCFADDVEPAGENNGNSDAGTSDGGDCVPSGDGEVCDGKDNDCDGEVDEDFDVGDSCSAGMGACAQEGELVCNQAGDGTECNVTGDQSQVSNEICDDIDNDCDGDVDEGYDAKGDECTVGDGACAVTGTLQCKASGDGLACDATPDDPPEADEITCDDIDNDCDGDIDEGCDDDGDGYCDVDMTVASGVTPAVCTEGGGDCNDEAADVFPNAPGKCDGLDNDCDGKVDNFKPIDRVDPIFEFSEVGLHVDNKLSPILAAKSDTGFCVAMYDDAQSRVFLAHLDTSADAKNFNDQSVSGTNESIEDLAWDGTSCTALVRAKAASAWTLHVIRKTALGSNIIHTTVSDGDHFVLDEPSWASALYPYGNSWVILHTRDQDTSGTGNARYTTVQRQYTEDGPIGSYVDSGIPYLGTGYELSAAAGNTYHFMVYTNAFGYITAWGQELGVVGQKEADLDLDGGRIWADKLFDELYMFHGADGQTTAVRKIGADLTYHAEGTLPGAPYESQEYFTRDVFSEGPEQSMWVIDPVSDTTNRFEVSGAQISFETIDHPNITGDVIGIRQDGDEMVVLSVEDVGTSGDQNDPLKLRASAYTCY